MASAYSILRNYGDYIQPYDFNLIQQGLEYKQQKYDANSARIQAQIDQFANLDLAKDEDRQYLSQRLQGLVEQVNEHGAIDLSSNGVTRNITNHIKQVLDENVMTAYSSTQRFRKEQEEIEWVKKNRPKQYHIKNHNYALRNYQNWVNDGKAGTSYTGSTYTPYVNVDSVLKDAIKNADKYLTNITKHTTLEGDYFVDSEQKIVSPERLESLLRSELSGLDAQLEIDSYYGVSKNFTNSDYKDIKRKQLDTINENIGIYKAQLKDYPKGSAGHNSLQTKIQDLKDQSTTVKSALDLDMSDEQSRLMYYKDSKIGGYLSTYSGILESSNTVRANSIPLQRERLEIKKEELREKKRQTRLMEQQTRLQQQQYIQQQNDKYQTVNQEDTDDPSKKDIRKNVTEKYDDLKRRYRSSFMTQLEKDKIRLKGKESEFKKLYGYGFDEINGNIESAYNYFAEQLGQGMVSVNGIESGLRGLAKEYYVYNKEYNNHHNSNLTDYGKHIDDQIEIIFKGGNGEESQMLNNLYVPTFSVKEDDNGEVFVQLGRAKAVGSIAEYSYDNLDNLVTKNGKTFKVNGKGITYRELLRNSLAMQKAGLARESSGKEKEYELALNYVAQNLGGVKADNYEDVKENTSLFGSILDKTWAGIKTAWYSPLNGASRLMNETKANENFMEAFTEFVSTDIDTKATAAYKDVLAHSKSYKVQGKDYNLFDDLVKRTGVNRFAGGQQIGIFKDLDTKTDRVREFTRGDVDLTNAKKLNGNVYLLEDGKSYYYKDEDIVVHRREGEDSGLDYIDDFDVSKDYRDRIGFNEEFLEAKEDAFYKKLYGYEDNYKDVIFTDKKQKELMTTLGIGAGVIEGKGKVIGISPSPDGQFGLIVMNEDGKREVVPFAKDNIPNSILNDVDVSPSRGFTLDARLTDTPYKSKSYFMSREDSHAFLNANPRYMQLKKEGLWMDKETYVQSINTLVDKYPEAEQIKEEYADAYSILKDGFLEREAIPVGGQYTIRTKLGGITIKEEETYSPQLSQQQSDLIDNLDVYQTQIIKSFIDQSGGVKEFLYHLEKLNRQAKEAKEDE